MRSTYIVLFAVISVGLMMVPALDPVVSSWVEGSGNDGPTRVDLVPGPYRNLKKLVDDLMEVTTDWTDSDNDTIPDSIERIIGTDPGNIDSDHDQLNDSYEISLNMDPLDMDSNEDGITDNREVLGVEIDIDNDGVINSWDRDNDGDGLEDDMDISPFAKTGLKYSHNMNIRTGGNPLYLTYQVTPKNPEVLKLVQDQLNWPNDDKGAMMDLDNSEGDLHTYPVLEVRSNKIPALEDVTNYGISISDDIMNVPLSPEFKYGKVVSLKGKIFFPASGGPMDLNLSIDLVWKVVGLTDVEVIQMFSSNGKTLTASSGGSVSFKTNIHEDDQKFHKEVIDHNTISLLSMSGKYLGIDDDGLLKAKWDSPVGGCHFDVIELPDGVQLVDSDGNYLNVISDSVIKAVSENDLGSGENSVFDLDHERYDQFPVPLIEYPLEFTIAGLDVYENHGSEIGLVYGADLKEMITSNLALTVDFVRNRSNTMDDIIPLVEGVGDSLKVKKGSFSHRDEAMVQCMGEWVIEALNELPQGQNLPITILTEDNFIAFDLYDLGLNSSGSLDLDMSSSDVVTSRTMKTPWYNVPEQTPLGWDSIIPELETLTSGMDDNDAERIMGTILVWNLGDYNIISIGSFLPEDAVPLSGDVIDLDVWKLSSWGILTVISIAGLLYPIVELTFVGFKAANTVWKAASTTIKFFKVASTFFDIIGPIMDIIGFVVESVFIIISLVSMLNAAGGDPLGTTYAWVYYAVSLTFALISFGIALTFTILGIIAGCALSGPVGWVVGAVIAIVSLIVAIGLIAIEFIFDAIFGFSIVDWVVSWFVDVKERVKLDMLIEDSSLEIHDKTGNGLDGNDRIEVFSMIRTYVNKTDKGSIQDLQEAYIKPSYRIHLPWQDLTFAERVGLEYGMYSDVIQDDNNLADGSKEQVYKTGAWVEPGCGMINYPFVTSMNVEYQTFIWEKNVFDRSSQERRSEYDYNAGDPTTSYFDIMPPTLEGLASWRAINHSDIDGDGMSDQEERENGTHTRKWDTDGDKLGDKFEIDMGFDPLEADSDRDGLWDLGEMLTGLDPRDEDTDGDGLTDFQELEGWVVPFEYNNHSFEWHIVSDPLSPDTDGDGLNDSVEYLCLLNPRSYDTDGNGIQDELIGYTLTDITYFDAIGSEDGIDIDAIGDIEVDQDGNLYVIDREYRTILKISPEGDLEWTYSDLETPVYGGVRCIDIGPDGMIYAAVTLEFGYNYGIQVIHPNGTLNRSFNVNAPEWVDEIALDEEGFIYVFSSTDGVEPTFTKIHPNGTTVKKIIFNRGDGPGEFKLDWKHSIDVDSRGNIYITDPGNYRIQGFDKEFNLLPMNWQVPQFGIVRDMWIDDLDNFYLTGYNNDYDRVEKFNRYRRSEFSWQTDLDDRSICSDNNGLIFIAGSTRAEPSSGQINIYQENITIVKVKDNFTYIDADDDELPDDWEDAGWTVEVVFQSGMEIYNVSSNNRMPDTDMDGLSDLDEFNISSDPEKPDTDRDGVIDPVEVEIGTNATHWDTDLDGLDDGFEVGAGTSPLTNDTDGDGLNDRLEFEIGTNPNDPDTDKDHLTDHDEWLIGWDPLSPDNDEDFMFDGYEFNEGCDPDDSDDDGDGIPDGYEQIYDTDPTNGDSDGDGLNDGFEVAMDLNPTNNDTDGDGLIDSVEIELGFNPWSQDSDGDGIPDGMDMDFSFDLEDEIIITTDDSKKGEMFVENISRYAEIKAVDPMKLVSNHSDSKYIVIIGDPDDDSESGKLVNNLLKDSGDLLTRMRTSRNDRCIVRYGVWGEEQTIVLISEPYPFDHNRVLGILKSMKLAMQNGVVVADYISPTNWFILGDYDVVQQTGVTIQGGLVSNETFEVAIISLSSSNILAPMSMENGLFPEEIPLGKYVVFLIMDRNGVEMEDANITTAEFRIYYTELDLDRTGDGDSKDPADLDESTLSLFLHDNGSWSRLVDDLDWVMEAGVNTTDQKIHGMQYAGYLFARTTHLSLFGIAGLENIESTFVLDIGPIHDEDGDTLFGVNVSIDVNGVWLDDMPGYFGLTRFELLDGYKGHQIVVNIEKEGYHSVSYSTRITEDGKLENQPPPMAKVHVSEDEPVWATLLSLIAMLVVVLMLVSGSIIRGDRKKEE